MTYREQKENARAQAAEIQERLAESSMSYKELAEIQSKLERIGRRYGLIREFRENGII